MDPILRLALAVVGALAGGAALLTAPCVAAAADPTPRDFAYGIPVVTTRDAAVYRFALPLAVYRDTTREDLGDVRIFNAQGEAVPYSLMRAVPPPRAREPAIGLPLFPLRGTAHIVMDGQHIAIESPGSSVNLRTQPVDPNTTVNQYVLDGRMMNAAVAALELNWPDTAVDYSGRIKVEASDDLDSWQTVVAAAPTANLHANGQALIENRVALPPTQAKFWRISWVGPAPRFTLASVLAEPAGSPVESAHDSLDVNGTAAAAETDADVFDLGAHVPVSRINVMLPEVNTVNTIEVSSRRSPGEPWRAVAQSGFYRLNTPEGEQHNAPLEIGVDRDRYWRTRIVRGGGASQAPLRLHVEWVPNDVTFLARGRAPFVLAYGSATTTGSEIDLNQVPADVEIAPATVGEVQVLGGPERLAPTAARVPRLRIVLWAALLLALALLGWMALRPSKTARGRGPA